MIKTIFQKILLAPKVNLRFVDIIAYKIRSFKKDEHITSLGAFETGPKIYPGNIFRGTPIEFWEYLPIKISNNLIYFLFKFRKRCWFQFFTLTFIWPGFLYSEFMKMLKNTSSESSEYSSRSATTGTALGCFKSVRNLTFWERLMEQS